MARIADELPEQRTIQIPRLAHVASLHLLDQSLQRRDGGSPLSLLALAELHDIPPCAERQALFTVPEKLQLRVELIPGRSRLPGPFPVKAVDNLQVGLQPP